MPAAYTSFFTTSTQASAALIGLLFVSVSIAPDRIFGSEGSAEHQLLAVSAFTALVNVFFVSFISLLPSPMLAAGEPIHAGIAGVVFAALALSQTLALLLLLPRWRTEQRLLRGLTAFGVSGGLYVYELITAIAVVRDPSDLGSLTQLLALLLGAYAIGLARAWQLLGARRARGLLSQLRSLISGRAAGGDPISSDGTDQGGGV